MNRIHPALLFFLVCPLAIPVMAQTQIGGGTCNSSTLSGNYALTLSGRQSSAAGTSAIFQANGTANFDGQNKVTFTLTANTIPALGTSLTWSGTYSTQANCAGVITFNTGSSATLNLAIYNQGSSLLLTGNDGAYEYNGGGNIAPKTACAANLLSGVYVFNVSGSVLTSGSAAIGTQSAGLLQFDGQTAVTANFTTYATGSTPANSTLTGTYTIGANCLGSATLTDASANTYTMTFSATNSNAISTKDFDITLAQASKLLQTGSAHAAYNQPTAVASIRHSSGKGVRA